MERRKRMKLEDTGIYANTSELMKAVYTAIFAFPKKDRVVMGDMLMTAVTGMLSDFAMSYRLPRERLAYADRFLARFESFKGLVRVSKELKRLNAKDHMAIMVLMMRIDEGISKWRSSASAVQASTCSAPASSSTGNMRTTRLSPGRSGRRRGGRTRSPGRATRSGCSRR
jgi:hypothetical protein